MTAAVTLYIGHDCSSLQGRRFALTGPRMFNGRHTPLTRFLPAEVPLLDGMCDSGAFQDPPTRRRTPAEALAAQLRFETLASEKYGAPYRHRSIVSYDLLIDEKWVGTRRKRERWTVADADAAVRATIDGAAFLASQRSVLAPRQLMLAAQGVDHIQYTDCARAVLAHCTPNDIFGLGGWCILGAQQRWLPQFWATLRSVLPLVAAAGLTRVHIFGVTYTRALGGLVWLADQYNLTVSSDSKRPAYQMTWKSDENKARTRAPCATWEANCRWWSDTLANLRSSPHYREPPSPRASRQLTLF